MRVRHATPADADAIHGVSVASCRAAYEGVLKHDALLEMVDDPSRVGELRTKLSEVESAETVIYLVAERTDGVVGFLQLVFGDRRPEHIDAGSAYLKSLYVHPDAWGEGIGSELLADGLDRLPDRLDRVELGVLAANDVGKRFYESRGFEQVDTGTFDVGDVSYETDIYAKDLPSATHR